MTSTGAQRHALVLLGCLLAVGGCTSAEEPTPVPTSTSASPTPQPTAEPTEAAVIEPPKKPAAMLNNDEAGARAAADYFLALYGYSFQSGDVDALAEFCDPESTFCSGVVEEVTDQVNRGLTFAGGEVAWETEPTLTREEDSTAYQWSGRTWQEPAEILESDGSVETSRPGVGVDLHVFVYFRDGEWTGFEITQ